MSDGKIKIANPDRIKRILTRIADANLQLLVRVSQANSIAVKGWASGIIGRGGDGTFAGMRISNVSDKGIEYLNDVKSVQIEFVMMSTKVSFVTNILMREQNSFVVAFPQVLISLERRQAARFTTTQTNTAYVKVGLWVPNDEDVGAMPLFPHYKERRSQLQVVDISKGGFCLVSRFPSYMEEMNRGRIDSNAQFLFPMQAPISFSYEIRWRKAIKEHPSSTVIGGVPYNTYKIGCEFRKEDPILESAIRQFVYQLSGEEAI